jgi:hypothetical protein
MARVLHLLKGPESGLALTVIARQADAGDTVTVALLPGMGALALPAGVTGYRVPDELSYAALLDLVFEADHVLTW